ncbi:MAG: glycosyltransferase family 4 protein, partial [Hydrogenimonas sp.]|nr:glycosyltransferase family 4 protein [Hydrogenimonas sp.]
FTFIYVGRIIPHKNIQTAIEAFIKAFGKGNDYLFRVVGTGESLDDLKEYYKNRRNICFEGAKFGSDLVEAYHTSHVLVIPSLYEPWGLVVNEALSAGMPVLASDRVGARYDLIDGRDTGFIFDPENIEQLAGLMKKIADDRSLYIRQSKNAAALMKDEWNYDLYRKNLTKAIEFVDRKLHRSGS